MQDSQDNKHFQDIRKFSSFDRDLRLDKYKANQYNEKIFDLLNNQLVPVDDVISKGLVTNSFPSIIVTGVPRSGTTFLTQLLSSQYEVGYVSNLMARFYMSPLTGAWLQKQLMKDEIRSLQSFRSQHGVTENIYEPHEFGWFWSQYLYFGTDYHEPKEQSEIERINFEGLSNTLDDISKVFNSAVVYKCALAPFLIRPIMENTNVFLVHITRNKRDVIKSILRVRKQRLGNVKKWWSVRPYGWENMLEKKPEEQVDWQYKKILEAVYEGTRNFGFRTYEIKLEELVKSPENVLSNIVEKYKSYSNIEIHKATRFDSK